MELRLSPSALNLFLNCPRCFWMDKVKGFRRPRGIFPSLPSGMDIAIKSHFDRFRALGRLPAELTGQEFEGVELFRDQPLLDEWRDWRRGLIFHEEGVMLGGALDDLLVKGGLHIPFDYKTKGSPATPEEAVQYYQNQLDCYSLLLQRNGYPPADYAYVIYYSPKTVNENGNVIFHLQPIRIATDPARAYATFRAAVELVLGPLPPVNPNCEYCHYLEGYRRHQHNISEERVR